MARRAHLAATCSAILVGVGVIYSITFGMMGLPILTLACVIGGTFSAVSLAVLRSTGSVTLAGHCISATVAAAVTIAVSGIGGIHTGALVWYAVPPVMAASISGIAAARFWGALSVVAIIGLALVDSAGLTPTSEIPPVAYGFVVVALAGGSLIVITLFGVDQTRGIAWLLGEVQQAQRKADSAHKEARVLLDNISDGLVTLGPDGKLSSERSRRFDQLFGEPAVGTPVWTLFEADPSTALWLEAGWEQLFEGFMPMEVSAEQLPKQAKLADVEFELTWQPIEASSDHPKVLLIAKDVTAERAARRQALRERSELNLFRQIVADREGFKSFLGEAKRLVTQALAPESSVADVMRSVHTLKGAAGVLGLSDFESLCHSLETELQDAAVFEDAQRGRLSKAWASLEEQALLLLGDETSEDDVRVSQTDHRELVATLDSLGAAPDLVDKVRQWRWPSANVYLQRLAEQARAIADRRAISELSVSIDDGGIRLPHRGWDEFWMSCVHLVRNALDHGVEPAAERRAQGKTWPPTLSLETRRVDERVVFSIADDGRGIDWDAVASAADVSREDHQGLVQALFSHGVTTREEVGMLSGRGVGTTAVLEAAQRLGGAPSITSQRGQGTTVSFSFPAPRDSLRRHAVTKPKKRPVLSTNLAPLSSAPPDGEGHRAKRQRATVPPSGADARPAST